MRLNKKYCFLFLFIFSAAFLAFAQVGLRISPPIIDLTLARGGTKVFYFELYNENKEIPFTFKIFPMDLDADRTGASIFLEAGKSQYSCSKWIQVEPKEVVVEPGKTRKIIGKLSVPTSASGGGYYSAIVCELVRKPSNVTQGAVITWRIATLMKLTVQGGRIERKASIEDFLLRTLFENEGEKKGGLHFLASVRNEGNIHVKAEGKLTVLTTDRKRKGEADFDVGTGTVLPEHLRDFTAVYDKFLSEGEYIARATFKYGGTSTLEKEIPFTVTASQGQGNLPKEGTLVISSLKVIPEQFSFKIPAGGFRTSGFAIQNQRNDRLRVKIAMDNSLGIQDWFSLEPAEVVIEGGKEAKVQLKVNVPPEAKEGVFKTKITLSPFLITAQGIEEKLEQVNIEIDLETPKF